MTRQAQLLRVSLKRAPAAGEKDFPFSIPAIRTLPPLDLSARVTFFVGENGSGKSTLLEGLAAAANLPTVGAAEIGRDGTLAAQRLLAARLQLNWAQRTHRGFFLRAEDFFGFQHRLAAERVVRNDRPSKEHHDRQAQRPGQEMRDADRQGKTGFARPVLSERSGQVIRSHGSFLANQTLS